MTDRDQSYDPADDLLERFRRQWHDEIAASTGRLTTVQEELNATELPSSDPSGSTSMPENDNIGRDGRNTENHEEEARKMYMKGVSFEQSGQVVEAIRYYKRAMQLVPDIEKKVYSPKPKEELEETDSNVKVEARDSDERVDDEVIEEEQDDDDCPDLLQKFQRYIQRERRMCAYKEEPKSTHFSALPCELVVYLLKWVISADLDLRSLEQVSLVCRGLYVCCRDAELWKLVCMRVWNADCGNPQRHGFNSWREMYINRPRLRFNGCYISKTTYVRPGENSFQDTNYQPWHLVTYFRYIRFFPEGLALLLTTADGPSLTVGHLRRRGVRHSALMKGCFSLKGNTVLAVFKKQHKSVPVDIHPRFRRRRDPNNNDGSTIVEQVFELELEIRAHKKRAHWTLHWVRYVVTTKYQNGERTATPYDMNATRFPPLFYSRVRSYTAESENPLSL